MSNFHDLRSIPDHASYQTDTTTACPFGQALDRFLRAGRNGLIYPSVGRPGGGCKAVFRPGLSVRVIT
ncbi:RES family NAD+ phosphorylase [Brucella cytisi]|uniref:RES family NAD+ phosphorylase n=1 Tax=Brucella cytisi TaxID=407152 RepID=UPI001160CAF8